MASLTTGRGSWLPAMADDLRHPFARRSDHRRAQEAKLLIAGAVVVGVGFLAWHYLGPDIRRYIKISRM
jgi:hypothetical protein